MINKVTTLTEAVKLVREGDTLALGGMTLYRRPVAFVRELIRQGGPFGNLSTSLRAGLGTGDLTLLAFTASFASDLLVGAGLVSRVRSCYFGMEAFGLAPMFTKLATAGEVKVIEETEASIAFGLRATLAGVGFMPGQGWLETDLLKVRPDVQLVDDPYSDRRYVAFPAIKPNVAVIHARLADPYGNAVLGGNLAVDWELTMSSERVIITAERVVDKLEERADTVGLRVTAVVEAPAGARPTSCYPDYPLDSAEILRYVETCARGGFAEYLEEFINNSEFPNHNAQY
ncbi:MAG TPA: CoA transferase subunit A [Anaerolineae bacterium]|nr:CoA transferase subunit A [Anaerolineae bacterium]